MTTPALRRFLGSLLRSGGLYVEVIARAHDLLRVALPESARLPGADVRLPRLSALDLQKPMTVRAMKDGAVEFLTTSRLDQKLLDANLLGLERARRARAQWAESQEFHSRYRPLTSELQGLPGLRAPIPGSPSVLISAAESH